MHWTTSLPVLIGLGWFMVGIILWDYRSHIIPADQATWPAIAMTLVALAMIALLLGPPSPLTHLGVRLMLLCIASFGAWHFARKAIRRSRG
jgi:hypothetical protein